MMRLMVGRAGVVACALGCALAGCGQGGAFSCEDDSQCDPAGGGRCEPTGFCAFPDPECESGYRYGAHAGSFTMQCAALPGGESDGTTEAAVTSASAVSDGSEGPSTSTDAPVVDDTTGAGNVCPDWWDCAWAFRREIQISGDRVAASLDDFPVPVVLDDISDPTRFGPDGLDLRVVADDGTLLDFEIDTWAPGEHAVVWVRVPRIEAGSGARAMLYYGRPDAPPLDTGPSVWDPSFVAVWHLDDGSDSTANENHAEDQGTSPALGVYGGARDFDAEDERLLVPPSASLADLAVDGVTVTALFAPRSAAIVSNGRIVDTAEATNATVGITVLTNANQNGLEFNRGATTEGSWIASSSLAYDTWQHLALTFADGEVPTAFLDGQPVVWDTLVDPVGSPGSDVDAPVALGGATYDGTHTFDGALDEIRLSRGARPEAWLLAEHLASTGQLVTIGPEQSAPP